jgi:large subunit ribosomal protein L4e
MELKVFDENGEESGSVLLPKQFDEEIRADLVHKAILAIWSHKRQPYGAKTDAGMRASAKLSRRRRAYRGGYGKGMSRIPRKVMTRRGTQMHLVGAVVPGTVGGRRAHAPKAEKKWDIKINDKERRKAIRSALSAVMKSDIVKARGHRIPENYPFVLDNSFESLDKTKQIVDVLKKLKFDAELERTSVKKIRAGKGKARGRKYVTKVGPLVVVGENCALQKSARNVLGLDIVKVNEVNAELLAPGTHLGRLTLFTKSALEKLEKEKLFM